ncbi:MAG: GNAT family protein [Terriglobia bacterium]|jgi:RimJ/RimL family protein N-acetyltransferase|nr:GNAT family protein [Terriglobia bacterium]
MGEKNFPRKIETERLILRPYRAGDALELLGLVDGNRLELIREFAQIAALQNREQMDNFILTKREQWEQRKNFCYGIWQKGAEQLIGQIQVKNITWEIPAAELSYFIGKESQRRGYASECIRAVVAMAFDELQFERIFVRILPSNVKSRAIAKKLGFQEEGLHRNAFRCGFGQLHDVYYLSATKGNH